MERNEIKIQGGSDVHICAAKQKCSIMTGWAMLVVYQFMLKAGGTGQVVHVLTAKQMCSVIETGKGFSQELGEKSGSVSIYIEGGGLQASWGEQITLSSPDENILELNRQETR